MANVIQQNRISLWVQPDGKGNELDLLDVPRYGAGDKTIPFAGRELVAGRDVYGNPKVKDIIKTAPGGLITLNVEWDKLDVVQYLEKIARCGTDFGLWEFWMRCGTVDNLGNWGRLDYYGNLGVTQIVQGAGPTRDGAGANVANNVDTSGLAWIVWRPLALTLQTNPSVANLNDIAGLPECDEDCYQGYPGADEVLYAVADSNTGSASADADVIYTINGGSSWHKVNPEPFADGENIGDIELMRISASQYRAIVGRSSGDVGNAAEVAWSNFTHGDPGTATWTAVDVGTTGNDTIQSLAWLFYTRVYAATGGDIYVSTDQGESFGTAVYTGANAINAFTRDKDDNVWAVGASNTILREVGKSSTFDTLTGPSGGGAFTAIAVANDGLIYAGNGTSLYVNDNSALNTGGWTELKDFGVSHAVVGIKCSGQHSLDGGDSQLIQVVVDDSTPGNGELWYSWDGGDSFRQVTEVTNTGYNAAYFSRQDDNLLFIAGDVNATPMGVIHKAAPCVSC